MQDEDPVAVAAWRGEEGWDEITTDLIPCPLMGGNLTAYYSLDRVAEEKGTCLEQWNREQEAQHVVMEGKDLTRKRKHKGGRALVEGSQTTRVRCQKEFVGFAVLHQGKPATIALVMDGMLASKFMGFLKARGHADNTMMKLCSQLSETVDFVSSSKWPGEERWDAAKVQAIKDWYANLRTNCRASIIQAPISQPSKVTLWKGMMHAQAMWDKFISDFKVCVGV
jgi:hypothetical protein